MRGTESQSAAQTQATMGFKEFRCPNKRLNQRYTRPLFRVLKPADYGVSLKGSHYRSNITAHRDDPYQQGETTMQLLLIRRSDRQSTTLPVRLLIKGFRFEVERRSGKYPDQDADDHYDLAIVDLSQLDRTMQSLLDQQQDCAHVPMIALVPNEALAGRNSKETLCQMAAGSNPVAMPELTSRMQATVDRMAGPSGKVFRAAGLTVSPEAGYAAFSGAPLSLSRRELAALTLLVRFAPHIVPRQRLETRLYGPDAVLTPNAIEAVLSRLRRSLKDAGCTARIVAHRVVGWSLKSSEGDSR